MTSTADAAGDHSVVACPYTELPLVSVVIVNFNYGRFLHDAVRSVFGQTYANKASYDGGRVECVVVDNASTDESPAVLAALERAHPSLKVIRRAANDGQTPASLDGLLACTGQYVIFLDADDYLLPLCVETHVYVHLSMRPHVGLTSGDMLQVKNGQVVVATGEESNRYIRGGRGIRPHLVRPYSATEGWPSPSVRACATKIHYIPPLRVGWSWSPTSGLCYRRDALDLFADNDQLRTLRTGTDLYFAYACSGLSGSVLIDEPVFAYRVHGGNIFTSHAQLDRTLNFTPGGHGDSNVKAQFYLIDHLVSRAARFAPNRNLKLNLFALLFRLDRHNPDPTLPRWARRSRVAHAIVRDWKTFSGAMSPSFARAIIMFLALSLRSPEALRVGLPAPQQQPR